MSQSVVTNTIVSSNTVENILKRKSKIIIAILCIIMATVFFTPYLYLLFSSLKPSNEVIAAPPTILPSKISFENYIKMFKYLPIGKYFTNSLVAALISTIISVFLGSLASYGISRVNSSLSSLLLIMVLCLKMIPFSSIAVPIYGLIKSMGLYDSIIALILVYSAINMPFVLWMMVGFFKGVPKELDEAARVDGESPLGAFIKIILPVSLPGIATTAIFTMLMAWNDFLFALLLTSTSAKTVPVGLSEFLTAYNLDLGPMTAAAILFSLPVLIVSFFIQKYIVSGMTAGAVKG